MTKKILKDLFKQQDLVISVFQQIIDPDVTWNLGQTGIDCIILDLEHTGKTMEAAKLCITAANAVDVPVIVRVYDKFQWMIEQALDAGAQGVLVPTVETVEEAKLIVRSGRFAPEGERGYCPVVPAQRWMNNFNWETYTNDVNRDIFLAALVESPLGFQNLPDMLKVDGIDAWFTGRVDLSIRIAGSFAMDGTLNQKVDQMEMDAIKLIAAAGKIAAPIANASNIARYYAAGSRMVMAGTSDGGGIQMGVPQVTQPMREIVKNLAQK